MHERTKFSKQASLCAFVGYSIDQKGFLYYDPKIRHISVSRHVVFLENIFYYVFIANVKGPLVPFFTYILRVH